MFAGDRFDFVALAFLPDATDLAFFADFRTTGPRKLAPI